MGLAPFLIDSPFSSSYTFLMASKVVVYSDGGARGNPGPAAIGVLILDSKGHILKEHKETIGEATNNVAEYTAVLVGLALAKTVGAEEVQYFVDSQLVARQISGEYRVKAPHIKSLLLQVRQKIDSFRKVTVKQVPRSHENIEHVDGLVNEALDEARH